MKKSRYTEEQIVGVLKESEAGLDDGGAVPQARDQPADVLSLEGEVRRAGSERSAAAAAAGRREPQAEAAGGRAGAGHRRFQGGAVKKVVGPQAEREAVSVFREATECSERHACGQMEILRAMVRYRPRARPVCGGQRAAARASAGAGRRAAALGISAACIFC